MCLSHTSDLSSPSRKTTTQPNSSPANGGSAAAAANSDLLPSLGGLAAAGYSIEPSLRQLQALAAADPAALAAVEGFTLTRRGVGSLRWLAPVDVRGLDLEAVARIDAGEVAVYTDAPKPPVGEGLNTACEVTLLGVHKRKGGAVVTDAAAVAGFEKRLRRYCAEAGAEFVAYKPDGGVWRFRVEHFSRYGVPMDEDDGDDDDGGDAGDEEGEPAAASAGKGRRFGAGGLAGDESDGDRAGASGDADSLMAASGDDDVVLLPPEDEAAAAAEASDGAAAGAGLALTAAAPGLASSALGKRGVSAARAGGLWDDGDDDEADGAGAAAAEPLQHSLPALLSLQPARLAAMRDSFFRQGGAAAADAASAEAALAVVPPGEQSFGGRLAADGGVVRRAAGDAPASSVHNWTRPRPALLAAAGEARGGEQQQQQQQQQQSLALVAGMSSPTRLRTAAARAGPLVPESALSAASGSVCDAFLLAGRSFRAGFGPGGRLAYAVNAASPVGAPAPAIAVARVSPVAGVRASGNAAPAVDAGARASVLAAPPSAAAALRRRTLGALEAHLAMSRRAEASAEDAAAAAGRTRSKQRQQQQQQQPAVDALHWQLVCTRRQLPRLVDRQIAALGAPQQQQQQQPDGGASATDVGRAAELWRLVRVLFEHVDGEEGGSDDEEGQEEANDAAGGDGDGDDAMSLGGDDAAGSVFGGERRRQSSVRLAAYRRRAALSHWLAARCGGAVREAINAVAAAGGREALPWALLHLVAGHQLGAAAALAAGAGDARLAVLLSTAGRHAALSADVARQLQVWHAAGLWRDHFAQPRKLLLAVLSGRMGEAAAALQLDWPRALGLSLW